ncbi:2,5-diketo-D-gluconic acid reductase [Secundilactobacillus paracollinoides]|uniref:aldo/keto reductase n=1 Tax=Secundilactobacillus paracollinoides TaxID=240427 RepID=UPI00081AA765|nr:aldo/keto reductase [Secundilactobacillus paracollinoides]ANZ63612.1 2,5-diketo-D-gluconic acid reductase [Secundilactobacillus paracollinoides]
MEKTPSITLRDGTEMTQLGFGVLIPDTGSAKEAVSSAISLGYRLIDTASAYGNESAVGEAIKTSGINRNDLFITSKLWISDFAYESAKKGIDTSLSNLGLDYLDLYLLHQPYNDIFGAWRALAEAQKAGKIREIGVSNFYADQLKNLELTTNIKPAVNQIEVNPFHQQKKEIQFNQFEDVQVEAWSPFAEGQKNIFANATLKNIAEDHHKTSGQVILRWLLQRNIVVIPKSVHESRMKESLDIFDFQLSDDEMKQIGQLDTGKSQFFDHRDPQTIEQAFKMQ